LIEAMLKKIASDNKGLELPHFDQSAFDELMRYPWPGNVRELRNVIERACLVYPARLVEQTDIRNNLLRIKVPDPVEEQEALWAASSDLNPVDVDISLAADNPPLPHPSHYQDWFSFFDSIDLRRHLQDVEIVLIEAALKKSDGMISSAADALKLRRTTLIEKMKKFMIEKNA